MPPLTPTAPKVFFAAYSNRGSAHDLLIAAAQGRISLILSEYVLQETERNLLASAPRFHSTFLRFRDDVPYQLIRPSRSLIAETERVVVAKDAPIIAAARAAQALLVATYDRKDLLAKRQEILDAFGVTVATPEEILASL